jgi:hypothetical protein
MRPQQKRQYFERTEKCSKVVKPLTALPLRFAFLGFLSFLLRCFFLRRFLRDFLSFSPSLGKTDRNRLLAACDSPPRAAAFQSPGLALLHHPLDVGGGFSRILPCHVGSPGCRKTIFADSEGSHEARLPHRPGNGLPIQFSNSHVVRPDDRASGPPWFETRGAPALLTMRVSEPHPEEAPTGRANADDRLRAVSKDAAIALENTPNTTSRSRHACARVLL